MEDRIRTRKLPDGGTLRVNFHGEQKPAKARPNAKGAVTIDGQSFRVGDKLDAQRVIVAITEDKVQLEGVGTRQGKTWYKLNSPKLVAIKKRGEEK